MFRNNVAGLISVHLSCSIYFSRRTTWNGDSYYSRLASGSETVLRTASRGITLLTEITCLIFEGTNLWPLSVTEKWVLSVKSENSNVGFKVTQPTNQRVKLWWYSNLPLLRRWYTSAINIYAHSNSPFLVRCRAQ